MYFVNRHGRCDAVLVCAPWFRGVYRLCWHWRIAHPRCVAGRTFAAACIGVRLERALACRVQYLKFVQGTRTHARKENFPYPAFHTPTHGVKPAKGHDTALRALARLREQRWTLLLAGDHHGDLGPQMQALARELGIAERVRFLGLREDVSALLAASDLLLAPSRREALSLTLLEASACALPIVASRVGGIGEVVEDGASGALVAPDDPAALAAAIAPLLADPARRAAFGARARQRFEAGFTEDAMFDRTIAVYREACAR